jgi:hypothetical protein
LIIHSTKDIPSPSLTKRKFTQKSLSSIYSKSLVDHNLSSPQYSESFISNSNISRTETDSFYKDFSKHSSHSSSSNDNISAEYRKRIQLTNLHSLDFVQSPANFIYPNLRTVSSGYPPNQKNSIYVFSNTFSSNKNTPLVYLGNEIFISFLIFKFFQHRK